MANGDDLKRPEGSLLRASVVAAPLAVGTGVGLHRLLREGIIVPSTVSPLERAMESLKSVQGVVPAGISSKAYGAFVSKNLDYLSGEGADLTKGAWKEAMRGVDPIVQSQLRSVTRRIETLPPEIGSLNNLKYLSLDWGVKNIPPNLRAIINFL